jgi:hypothetical protein
MSVWQQEQSSGSSGVSSEGSAVASGVSAGPLLPCKQQQAAAASSEPQQQAASRRSSK